MSKKKRGARGRWVGRKTHTESFPMAMFSNLFSSTLRSFSGNLTLLLPSRAVTSRNTSPMEVIEFEIAPEMREEECSRSFSPPLLGAWPMGVLVFAAVEVEVVGLGRMR
jgi:hypothetical protein